MQTSPKMGANKASFMANVGAHRSIINALEFCTASFLMLVKLVASASLWSISIDPIITTPRNNNNKPKPEHYIKATMQHSHNSIPH